MKKLFLKIGVIFKYLFSGAQKTWNRLDDESKAVLLRASGITNIMNKFKGSVPFVILDEILKAYPELTPELVHGQLWPVAQQLNLPVSEDVLVLIQTIQKYLGDKEGRAWADASNTVAKVIAVFAAPPAAKVASIISLVVFVYHRYIKHDAA